MMCGLCDDDHSTRDCAAIARIQQSEHHAELPDRTDPVAVEEWLDE